MAEVIQFLGTFERKYPKPIQRRHADVVDISKAVRMTKRTENKKLKEVILTDMVTADFRYSDRTIWEDYVKRYRKKGYTWQENETVLFVSMSGHLAMWVVGESRINSSIVFDTRKWRLVGGGELWHEETLVYYAAQAGFKLTLPSEQKINEVLGYVVEVGD
jgi:hypothetical protein